SRNPLTRISRNISEKFSRRPQYVPMMALNISPRPAGIKNEMKITPVATIRSLTHADTAREMRESIRIQMAEHNTIGAIIHKCDRCGVRVALWSRFYVLNKYAVAELFKSRF